MMMWSERLWTKILDKSTSKEKSSWKGNFWVGFQKKIGFIQSPLDFNRPGICCPLWYSLYGIIFCRKNKISTEVTMKYSLKKLSKEKSLDLLLIGLILQIVHFLCTESWQHDSKNVVDASFEERNLMDFFFLSLSNSWFTTSSFFQMFTSLQ